MNTELEMKISLYCDELMSRESTYRKNGNSEAANEILIIVTELCEIIGMI